MASQNNKADYDRGFAAGVTAGLKQTSFNTIEEQKDLEATVVKVCEWLEALETKIQKQEDDLYRAPEFIMTMREALDGMNKRKREEAEVAKDVEEEKQKWMAKWWNGPKEDKREEARLMKNWDEVLNMVEEERKNAKEREIKNAREVRDRKLEEETRELRKEGIKWLNKNYQQGWSANEIDAYVERHRIKRGL